MRTNGGKTLCSGRTASLKTRAGLSGPPAQEGYATDSNIWRMNRQQLSDPRRSLLIKEISDAIPRNLWQSLGDLLILEHQYGVRDAVANIRKFREKRRKEPNSLASLFYSVPKDLESFEEYLLKEGRIPKGRPGRPRKDQETDQIILLKVEGKSWAQIARKLNKTADACRQLARRRISEMEAENKRMRTEIEGMKSPD